MIGLSLLLVLLVGGAWLCLSTDANRRMVLLACLVALLCPLIAVTFAMAEVESGTAVRQDGVLAVSNAGDGVTIGASCPRATINIPTAAQSVEAGWCAVVRLNERDSTMTFVPLDGVDAVVRVIGESWWKRPSRMEVLAGHEVAFGSAPMPLMGRSLTFRGSGARGTLAWGSSLSTLSDDKDVVDARLRAALKRGVQLCELRWTVDVPPCGSASLVMLDEGKSVLGMSLPLPAPFGTRLLISIADSSVRGNDVHLTSGDSLRVYSGGNAYDFALVGLAPNPYAPQVRGVAVRTVASWRRSRIPLVGTEMPVASTRLPSPTSQLWFGEAFGFVSGATSFLARITPTPRGVRLVVGGVAYELASTGTVIPVLSEKSRVGQAAFLVSARQSQAASSSRALLEGALLISLTLAVGLLMFPNGSTIRSPVALVVLGAVSLTTWRLLLAARLATAAPFIERATDRGGSLWTAVLVLVVLLSQSHHLGSRVDSVRQHLVRLGLVPVGPAAFAHAQWPLTAIGVLLGLLLVVAFKSTALGIAIALVLLMVFTASSSMLTSREIAQNGWMALVMGGGTAAAWLLASRLPVPMVGVSVAALGATGLASIHPRAAWLRALRVPGIATLAIASTSFFWPVVGTPISFALAVSLLLMSLTTGRVADAMTSGASLAASSGGASPIAPRFHHLAPFVIVLIALIAIALVDVGMAVVSAPAFVLGTAVAVNMRRAAWLAQIALGALLVTMSVVGFSILRPSAEGLADTTRPLTERVHAFNNAGGVVGSGLRFVGLGTSIDRSVVRWLAAHDPVGLEAVSAFVDASSAAASIERTLEHIRAMTQCARHATLFGKGFGRGTAIAAGVPAAVLGNDSAFAGLVLEEAGIIGGASVLLGYMLIAAGAMWALSIRNRAAQPAADSRLRAALILSVTTWITVEAFWSALSNVGWVAFTGISLPGLASFSAADALFGSALLVLVIMPVITICQD